MMKATHTNYKHPKHLRVAENGRAYCLSPSHSQYNKLNSPKLPDWLMLSPEERFTLMQEEAVK